MTKHIHIHLHRVKAQDAVPDDMQRKASALLTEWFNSPYANVWGGASYLRDRLRREIPGMSLVQAKEAHEAWARLNGSKDAYRGTFTVEVDEDRYDAFSPGRVVNWMGQNAKVLKRTLTEKKKSSTGELIPTKLLIQMETVDCKAHDSKLEDLERQLDEVETQIEKLEDTGQSPTRTLLDKRKDIQGAIAVIKSARKTGDDDQIGLWRYNSTTGYWVLERMCSTVSSGKWLEVFKKDEPSASFKLSKTKPSGKPTGDGEAPFRRPGHTLEDIAIGGTVIYKEGQKWALSKARQKREPGNLVLENGKTISILDVWSTDRSDWAKFEAANKTD